MTLRELAKLAHVSVSTVSKAFSGAEDISESTREMIFSLAKEHGCFGKYRRESYDKKVIVCLVPEIQSEHYSGFVREIQKNVERLGGILLTCAYDFDPEKSRALFSYCTDHLRADGIITLDCDNIPANRQRELPVVTFGGSDDRNFDHIVTSMDDAMNRAVALLKSHRHRSIAFIGEPLTQKKAELFRKSMEQNGLFCPPQAVITVQNRFEPAGEIGVRTLEKQFPSCTAAICAYDRIAFGVIKELKRRGKEVPKDFSVIGSDNISVTEYFDRPLTTINTYTEETCRTVCELLFQKIKSPFYTARRQIVIQSDLVERETVADAPNP